MLIDNLKCSQIVDFFDQKLGTQSWLLGSFQHDADPCWGLRGRPAPGPLFAFVISLHLFFFFSFPY